MAMEKSEFEALVKDTASEAMKGVMEEREKSMVEAIDAKIKEALGEVEKSRVVVGADTIDKDPKGGFKTLGQFASMVAKANKTGKMSDELGKWQVKAAGSPSHNISDNESGAYLIPDEWSSDIFKPITQDDMVVSRTRKVMIDRNTVNMPYVNGFDESSGKVYGAVQATWMDEEEAHTATAMKFGTMQLSLKKLGLFAYVTNEMIEDNPSAMEVILRDAFKDALVYEMNDKLIRGTGAGQPQGVLNSAALISVTAETGQAAATVLFENILKMYQRLYNKNNAVWMINDDCLPQICTMSIPVGTGGIPVFTPANGAAGRPMDTLMGLPIIWNKHCATLGTVGDIILADWSAYYLGLKAGSSSEGRYEVSSHLKFDVDQQTFKLIYRVDGSSSWKSAVTPPNSSATKSPFIVLATRS